MSITAHSIGMTGWKAGISKRLSAYRTLPFLACAAGLLVFVEMIYLIVTAQLGSMGGLEMADIAERIVLGYGFSSPYIPAGEGGPTSVSPPLYVWLMSGVYMLLGIKSEWSNTVLQIFNILFNVVTLIFLYRVCAAKFSELTARIFAILFALHPHILLISGSIWETGLSLMLLSCILWFVSLKFSHQSLTHCVLLGLLFGVTALSNPAWTLCYPIICIVLIWPRSINRRNFTKSVVALSTIFVSYLCIVSPWLIRNYATTGELMYVRNMAGPELFKGNHDYAGGGHGLGFQNYWIYKSQAEQTHYKNMGEKDYDQWMKQQALEYITNHPKHYTALVISRIGMWWSGDFDVLKKWHNVGDQRKFAFGVVLTIAGLVTSIFTLWGTWQLRSNTRQLWLIWIYIYFLPIPYYLIIIGFRYQSSLMAFALIPSAYCLSVLVDKLHAQAPNTRQLISHDHTA